MIKVHLPRASDDATVKDGRMSHPQEMGTCCAPGRVGSPRAGVAARSISALGAKPETLVRVPGGSFRMGSEDRFAYPADGEGPAHEVSLGPFLIDRYVVSSDRFAT